MTMQEREEFWRNCKYPQTGRLVTAVKRVFIVEFISFNAGVVIVDSNKHHRPGTNVCTFNIPAFKPIVKDSSGIWVPYSKSKSIYTKRVSRVKL